MKQPLLQIKKASVQFANIKAFRDIDITIFPQQDTGIIGESGCGKTTLLLYILQLLSHKARTQGELIFDTCSLLHLNNKKKRAFIGNNIGWIPQDPHTAFNPSLKIQTQLIEAMRTHKTYSKKQAIEKVLKLMQLVAIPSPSMRLQQYPHQLSGGIKQRILIAMSLSTNPKLLIADEPTAALDNCAKVALIKLLLSLKKQLGLTLLIASHDLPFVKKLCHTICVMYLGNIVEKASTNDLFQRSCHPYTQALIQSTPTLNTTKLQPIQGNANQTTKEAFCPFLHRCPSAMNICCEKKICSFTVNKRSIPCFLYDPNCPHNPNKGNHAPAIISAASNL